MSLRSKRHISSLPRTRSNERFLDIISSTSDMEDDISDVDRRRDTAKSSDDGIVNESFVPELPPKQSRMSSPSHNSDFYGSGDGNQSAHSDNTESYISDNVEALMPSHAYREIRGLPSNNVLKQNMRKTLRERRPQSRGRLETDVLSVDNVAVVNNEEQVFQGINLSHDEYSNLMGRQRDIKDMPTSIRRKRTIKNNMEINAKRTGKTKHISAWKHFKLTFAMGWQHFKDACSELLYELDLWRGHLKAIQGIFGSGVLSYFILLRWLFLINLVAFFSTIFFLFIPQMVYDPSYKSNNASFGGWELLTGNGYFTNTEMYCGIYTDKPIPMGSGLVYKMPLAYLCVGGGYLLLCLAIMVFTMAESYRENYIYTGDDFSFYVSKVFCAWDYGITDQESATLKQKSISNDLKEVIAEQLFNEERSGKELCFLVMMRAITNLIVLALTGGGCFLIYYTAQQSLKVDVKEFEKLLFPIIVSVLNLVLPVTFRIIASLEQYQHPKTSIQVNLARSVMLKLATIGMILISLFTDVTTCRKEGVKCLPAMKECWESYVGITFYRLVLVDFFFLLLSTFFGEFVRSLFAKHVGWCGQNIGFPGFDISRNVLDLVYAQTLAWIGTFFSPLLSVVNVLKLFLLFYVKRISVVRNCKASGRPFRAAKMNLLFLMLLAVSFMVALTTVGYTVMSEDWLKPSATCGPFRGQKRMYQVISNEIEDFPTVLKDAIRYLSSASFLTMIFCILGIIVYYYKMLKDSNEKKIKLLKDQIALAGQDKLFLMGKITAAAAATGLNSTSNVHS